MKTITREGIKRIVGPVSGSGGRSGAGGSDISLAGLASEAWVEENYISKAFFNRLFTIHSASGVIDPNDPDEEQTIDSIEALVGFWTDQYVSALGQNSGGGGGGGGGGVTLNQPLEAINNAGLSAPTTAGTMLVWYNGGWTYSPGARLQIGGITATGTVLVNSSVTANSFIKTGGTSSMFLKADGSVDTNTYASETWVSQNYVSIQFFETLFNAINAQGVKVNANSITGIDSIKAMFGLWTERYLSALGQNSGGGGGGGVTLNQPLSGINNAGMNAPGTAGSLLVWNGTTWTYSAAASIVATTATFYGNSYAAGFAVTNKDNTYVLLAGGGTKLLSELGGHTSVSYNGNVYSPSSGVVALGYLTTSVKVNSSTYSVNSSGLVDIGSVVTAVKIAGTQTPYSPTAGVVEIPAYPTIPTNVSAFTNDAGYVSTSVSLSDPHLVLASPSGSGGPASFRALVASDIPDLSSIYATSDTWRTVQCNGVSIGNNTLNLVAGTNVAISASNGTLTFSSTDTNTLNTAGAVQLGSTKLYLVGASSQTDGVQTYSNVNCYIGTDGCLYSGGSKVLTSIGALPIKSIKAGAYTWDVYSPYTTDITLDSVYLKLSGGTLSGAGKVLTLQNSNHGDIMLSLDRGSGNYTTWNMINTNGDLTFQEVQNGTGSNGLVIYSTPNNYATLYGNTLIHTGNISSYETKNTAGSTQLGSAKLYLIGASSQTTYGITYSNTGCYIGTDGCLYSGGNKVMTALGDIPTRDIHCGNDSWTFNSPYTTTVDLNNYYLQKTGGLVSGHIYLSGASSSSLSVTSQIVFGVPNTQYVAVSCNEYAIVINKSTSSSQGQIRLGVGNTFSYFNNSVGIGTENPSQKLHVVGSVQINSMVISQNDSTHYVTFSTGNNNVNFDIGSATAIYGKQFTSTSDIRKKNIVDNIDLNLGVIAQAPIFNFTWKDYQGTRPSVGTSAQYWEKVLPYSVSEGPDGYLAMDYGATALVAAVLTARKVSEHEQRIAELERENKVLWNMIATLKAS